MGMRRKERQGLRWVIYGVLLFSFAVLLKLSAFVSESGHPIAGAEVVVAGIIMSFASYALVKISR